MEHTRPTWSLFVGLAGVVLAGLAACGGSAERRSAPGPGDRAQPSPKVVAGVASTATPLKDRIRARIRVPSGDGITAAGDSIWVKTDDGHLVRVDPATNEVRSTLRLDTPGLGNRYCQAVGTDGDSVWTCATNARTTPVVRVDPGTGRIVETFDVDKLFDQLTLPFAFGRMWVLTGDGSTLVGLAARHAAPEPLTLEAPCAQVTPTRDDLVLTCPLDDAVRRIDPHSGKTLARAEIRHPFIVSASGGDVWVSSTDGLQRLDARTLAPKAVFRGLSPELAGDIVATGNDVWVRVEGGFLYRLDAAADAVTEQITADPDLSGGSLLVTDDSVWTTAYDDNVLFRVAP